ncbi:MAG TPA: hypothetical protein DDZ91_00685 [Firmicutes bacterium]|jgi:hypothetical protein|nr:hypothetical protein [Bacillota bacterium]
MKGAQLRSDLSNLLFTAFSIISVFSLLDPFIKEATETITINNQKIYMNLGWMEVYLCTLAITFILILLFMDKNKVWFLSIGVILGSFPIIDRYRVPGVGQILNLFDKQGTNLQDLLPYLTVLVGTLAILGLLKGANKVFK